jgi:Fic family protein
MQSFRDLDRHLGLAPARLVGALTHIEAARGRHQTLERLRPGALDGLREGALLQAVEASNAIESITATPTRLRAIVRAGSEPESLAEAEIAGYRRALAEIHSNASAIPFSESVMLQLHGWLYSYTGIAGGRYKNTENEVAEIGSDGTKVIRFVPVPMAQTPAAMAELYGRYRRALAAGEHHPLLLVGVFVFDFLCIHPFRDGNGRTSRLLTELALEHAGFEVGRYVSWERIVWRSVETYYEALGRSTPRWERSEHDLAPWLSYFLGVLIAAYGELDELSRTGAGRG